MKKMIDMGQEIPVVPNFESLHNHMKRAEKNKTKGGDHVKALLKDQQLRACRELNDFCFPSTYVLY